MIRTTWTVIVYSDFFTNPFNFLAERLIELDFFVFLNRILNNPNDSGEKSGFGLYVRSRSVYLNA